MAKHVFEIKKNKNSVTDFITQNFHDTRLSMQETYRSWMLNLTWTRGFQNVDFNLRDNKFQTYNQRSPWKVRLISNLMLPVARRMVTTLVQGSNTWDVIPGTSDEKDIQVAETATKVLLDLWQRREMDQKLIRLAWWQSVCSSAFLKVGWDPDAGEDKFLDPADVEPDALTEFMQFQGFDVVPEQIEVNQGEMFLDVVPPFNMIFDPNAAVMEDSLWSIESSLRSKDWIVDTYGSKYEKLTESSGHEQFLYPFVTNNQNTGGTRVPPEGILVHELFIKRSKKFKKGLHAIMAGGEMLRTPKDNPYEHGELPYAHFLEIHDPGSLYGTCSVEQIRPNQARYNRIQSGIMEQVNQMSNLQWLNPRQSGIKQFTNRPGQVLTYNSPHEPKQVQLRPIPAYVERLLDRTRLDMQDTSSTHDVSSAKAEPGVRSGRAVLALQDADDTILGPTLLWFDNAIAKAGRLSLQTMAQFVTEDRIAQVRGDFNEEQAIIFNSEVLQGDTKGADYWKVRTKTAGRQAMSRAGRESLVRVMLELGLLNPQTNKEELLQILGAADVLSLYDKGSADRTRQWKEIQVMKEGQEAIVYLGQNHQAHILAIKRFIASSEWEKLDQQIKVSINRHMSDHMQQEVLETIFPQLFAQTLNGGLENVLVAPKTNQDSAGPGGGGGQQPGGGAGVVPRAENQRSAAETGIGEGSVGLPGV